MQIKKHKTTINIDADSPPHDDWQWMAQRMFKATNLLRKKIKELREEDETGNVNYKIMNEKLNKRMSRMFDLLNETMSEEEIKEFVQKI